MMKVVLMGHGFVGKAIENAFSGIYNYDVVDPKYGVSMPTNLDYSCAIIAVNTPSNLDGSCDISHVLDALHSIKKDVPILIKSTISLEGWSAIKKSYPEKRIAFAPEFLTAANALEDFISQDVRYFGGDCCGFWIEFFRKRFPESEFTVKSVEELILTKYFRNSFLATKVAFFNQLYDLCEKSGIDFESVSNLVCQDSRIGHSHSSVTLERGFGGHCFPKDMLAIINTAKNLQVDLSIIEEAISYNNKIRKK